ncbi:MAG: hypothetical protein F6K21_14765 [Symploca sp. SIO2D2]|nr:hypothetical protein [Symploca sp. SIO2D2]
MKIRLLTSTLLATSIGTMAFAKPEKGDRPDPEEVVIELVSTYDIDENNALDEAELASGLEGLREQRRAKMKEMREKRRAEIAEGGGDKRGPGKGRRMDPSKVASHMIVQFDADDNDSLDSEELLEAMRFLHERRKNRLHRGSMGPSPEADAGESIE